MPASNARALEKAPGLDCDCMIVDLEDAIAGAPRALAHENLLSLVKGKDFSGKELVIRLSGFDDAAFEEDLAVALDCESDALLIPKVGEADTIVEIASRLSSMKSSARLWAMIETPSGLVNLREIASASDRLECLVVGPNDLADKTGVRIEPGRDVLKPWLMMVVAAARANQLSVLDGVYNRFRDVEGFESECTQGANMGFDGKTLIHPSQIEFANSAFGPSSDELARARTIIAAFETPENRDRGVISINGEMVERLHYEMALRLTELAGLA